MPSLMTPGLKKDFPDDPNASKIVSQTLKIIKKT